ncbi:hypothetical protein [Bradyrhizobium sp. USDA 4452]
MSNYDHWAPAVTGDGDIDFNLGMLHCAEAIKFAGHTRDLFLLFVLLAIAQRPIRDIEAGFLVALLKRAKVGTIAMPFDEETAAIISGSETGVLEDLRQGEVIMRDAILEAKYGDPSKAIDGVMWAITNTKRAALLMLARTAQNGASN